MFFGFLFNINGNNRKSVSAAGMLVPLLAVMPIELSHSSPDMVIMYISKRRHLVCCRVLWLHIDRGIARVRKIIIGNCN